MTTSLVLLLGLTVGLPCTLLALAIVYHARAAAAPMPAADDGWDFDAEYAPVPFNVPAPDAPATAEAEPALVELQHTVAELQQQLAGQRAAIASLLSERERAAEAAASVAIAPAPAPTAQTAPTAPEVVAATDLAQAVRLLAAEGMSERAIARRLRVGLEEVRLVSRRELVS